MASVIMNTFKKELFGGNYTLSAGNYYCALVTSSVSLSSDDQIRESTTWSQVSALEVAGTGYDSPGKLLTTLALGLDQTNDRAYWDAADVEWTGSSLSARGAFIYTSATNRLIAYIDFDEVKETNNGTFKIQWNSTGIIRGI